MKSKDIVIPLILLCLLCQCQTDRSNEGTNHYEIKLKLDPVTQYINVQTKLTLHAATFDPEKILFYLHKQFDLHSVSGHEVGSFTFDKNTPCPVSWIPEGRAITVNLISGLNDKMQIELMFEYEGIISEWPEWSANVVTEDWVELGLYLPWFPYNQDYGPFTFEIEAECGPEYRLRSFGDFKRKNDKWHFRWMSPTTDVVIVASKNMKSLKQDAGGKSIQIHYSRIHDTTAKKMMDDLIGIFKLFDSWFGGDKEGMIALIESLREQGGGYSRTGLISLAGLSDEGYVVRHEAYIRYLAHEAGHIWWHMAPKDGWEDWMNEGFAEYSALKVIREFFGEEAFSERLEAKKRNLLERPPIWGFDRNDRSTQEKSEAIEANLYSKGPVLLHLLEQRIGEEKFLALCQEMVASRTSSTEDLLILLSKNHGTELRNWFENLLKSY